MIATIRKWAPSVLVALVVFALMIAWREWLHEIMQALGYGGTGLALFGSDSTTKKTTNINKETYQTSEAGNIETGDGGRVSKVTAAKVGSITDGGAIQAAENLGSQAIRGGVGLAETALDATEATTTDALRRLDQAQSRVVTIAEQAAESEASQAVNNLARNATRVGLAALAVWGAVKIWGN